MINYWERKRGERPATSTVPEDADGASGGRGNHHGVLDEFKHYGVDAHNRSLTWIIETANILGAEIQTEVDANWGRYRHSFDVLLSGRDSGIRYKIAVSQSSKQLETIAKRMGEFEMDEKIASSMFHAFDQILDYRVSWWDISKSEWEGVCMGDKQGEDRPHWPGDGVVSMMYVLVNDLEQSLDPALKTLRREMRKALMVYWFNNKTSFDFTVNDISSYLDGLRDLQRAESEEEFMAIRDRILGSVMHWQEGLQLEWTEEE